MQWYIIVSYIINVILSTFDVMYHNFIFLMLYDLVSLFSSVYLKKKKAKHVFLFHKYSLNVLTTEQYVFLLSLFFMLSIC